MTVEQWFEIIEEGDDLKAIRRLLDNLIFYVPQIASTDDVGEVLNFITALRMQSMKDTP